MKKKLVLIIDKSGAYINFQRDRYLKQWGVDRKELNHIKSINGGGVGTLFGGVPCSLLVLENADEVKKTVKDLESLKDSTLEELFPSGLIITTTVARTYTKKLESLLSKAEGVVVTPPGKADDPVGLKLVNELNLKKSVKDFLLDYIGEDYDSAIPIVESLSEIPKQYHSKVTEEDLKLRLPQAPGAIQAWGIEDSILSGDVNESIKIARRVNAHSTHLLWLSFFKKKMLTYYRVSSLLSMNPRLKDDELAGLVEAPVKGFFYTKKKVNSHSKEKFDKAIIMVTQAEAKVKGGSAAPSDAVMESLIVELCDLFSKGR